MAAGLRDPPRPDGRRLTDFFIVLAVTAVVLIAIVAVLIRFLGGG